MVALQECVKAASNSEIILRNSHGVGESQSNGVVEKAVRDVEDQVRTLKGEAECRLIFRIGVKCPLLTWPVEHAAWLYNNYHEGKDKKIAIERLQGGRSVKPLAEFGESILYKPLSTKGDTVDKLEARLEEGIWLGVEPRTGEIRVGTASGWSRVAQSGGRLMLKGGMQHQHGRSSALRGIHCLAYRHGQAAPLSMCQDKITEIQMLRMRNQGSRRGE